MSSPSSTLAFDILFSDSTLTFDTPNSHIRYFELSHSILRTLTFDTPSSESELSHSTLFPLQTLTSVSPNSHIRYSELSHSIFRTLTSVSPNWPQLTGPNSHIRKSELLKSHTRKFSQLPLADVRVGSSCERIGGMSVFGDR